MKKLLLLLVLILLPNTANAQYIAGQNVTVAATHDGVNTDWFELFLSGTLISSKPVSELSGGEIRFPFTIPARGSYTIIVRARNDDQEFADSDPLAFTSVKGKPNKPGKPRIISTALSLIKKDKPIVLTARF